MARIEDEITWLTGNTPVSMDCLSEPMVCFNKAGSLNFSGSATSSSMATANTFLIFVLLVTADFEVSDFLALIASFFLYQQNISLGSYSLTTKAY